MGYLLLLVLIVLVLFVLPLLVGRKTGRLGLVTPVAAAVTGFVIWLGWSAIGEPTTWDEARLVDARTLEIRYTGSECEDQRSVSVDEDDDRVTISIKTRSFASACSDVGFQHRFKVSLDSKLDGRDVVDGHCSGSRRSCVRPSARRQVRAGTPPQESLTFGDGYALSDVRFHHDRRTGEHRSASGS